jgi:Flp pilus assembly protein CpaB
MVFRRTVPLSSKVFAALAAVLAAAAFSIVHAERQRYAALRPAVGPPVAVVVARTSMPRGSVLTAGNLESREVPEAFAPPGALPSIERSVGRVLAADMAAGEVVTRTRLVTARAGPLAGLVPGGLRAVALAAAVPAGLAAGDRIDVLASYPAEGRAYTETVGFALEVLRVDAPAAGGLVAAPSRGGRTVIVLTTPDVAERLATAIAFAVVQVTVVGPDELPPATSVSG